jgi:hypothetical protein
MLDSAKALFLGGGHEDAVADQGGGGVPVKRIESEDDHALSPGRGPSRALGLARRSSSAINASAVVRCSA